MQRRTLLKSAFLLPLLPDVFRSYAKAQDAKPTIIDMSREYEGLTYGTRTDMGYKAIAEMAEGFRRERGEGQSPLDHIKNIKKNAGQREKDLLVAGLGSRRDGGDGIIIKYGHGDNKLIALYDVFHSIDPKEESSTAFSWVESLKVSMKLFNPEDVSYIVLIHPNNVKQVVETIGYEARGSEVVLVLKGESPHPVEGLRILESHLGDESHKRNINGEMLTREMERMALETQTPLYNFKTRKIFEPGKDADRHEKCFETKLIDHYNDGRDIVSENNLFIYKIKVFMNIINPWDIFGEIHDDELRLSDPNYIKKIKTSNKLLTSISPSNTHFAARVEVPERWELEKRELDQTLMDVAFLNVEL